ncbi:MAG: four helix bundle protein [Candidatus Berkelbacteria bacterium]
MEENKNQPIKSFRDLIVYQKSYSSMLAVSNDILPFLPDHEKFDLKDQLSRSSKSIPRLIAEGYAKRHQKLGFKKYLDDAMGECNETIVSIEQSRDLYFKSDSKKNINCDQLVDEYDVIGRQIYCLANKWTNFH